jgi:hypothetical protein
MADYSLSATVIGADTLAQALKNVGSVATKAISDAIDAAGYNIQAYAVSHAPHLRGALWGSIHYEQSPGHKARIEGDNIVGVVGTDLEYARAQEYGTVGMTINVSRGRATSNGRTRPYTYIGNIRPKFYMRDAKEAGGPILSANLQSAVTKIIDSVRGQV